MHIIMNDIFGQKLVSPPPQDPVYRWDSASSQSTLTSGKSSLGKKSCLTPMFKWSCVPILMSLVNLKLLYLGSLTTGEETPNQHSL